MHAGGLGEDCAVIDFGDEVCLISSDPPITGAAEGIGELAVHVACNDIAANGGTPVGVQIVLLAPPVHIKEEQIRQIMADIQATAAALEVEVMGGHTEITSKVTDCVVSVTAVGRAPKGRYVTSQGAKPGGDDLIITKGLAIEATAILAREYAHLLSFPVSKGQISFSLSSFRWSPPKESWPPNTASMPCTILRKGACLVQCANCAMPPV